MPYLGYILAFLLFWTNKEHICQWCNGFQLEESNMYDRGVDQVSCGRMPPLPTRYLCSLPLRHNLHIDVQWWLSL
jgi:hypothetical protein